MITFDRQHEMHGFSYIPQHISYVLLCLSSNPFNLSLICVFSCVGHDVEHMNDMKLNRIK